MKGLLGGTFSVIGFLLFGTDNDKKKQIVNYAKATIPKATKVGGKVIGIAAEGFAKGAVEGMKNGR